MERVLEPEWLDELPPQDPRAVRSRADLRRVNWFMANAPILSRALRPVKPHATIADLGSGDGRLMLRVARRLGVPMDVTLVDQSPVVGTETLLEFESLGCKVRVAARDALSFLSEETVDIVVVNLFLHHLSDADLAKLFSLTSQRARVLVACEPRRSALALAGCSLMWLIGCNDVTRHDARVSVRAGFSGKELSRLWPSRGWRLEERAAPPFSHLFVARRDAL